MNVSGSVTTSSADMLRAWKTAVASYERSVSKKDCLQIQQSTSPKDILDYVEDLHTAKQHDRSTQRLEIIRSGLERFFRFSTAIDQLAQGSPKPASLLWGSIKFALIIVHGHAEEYGKLLDVLKCMADYLPFAERYLELLPGSRLLQDSVCKLYVSVIRFWERAIKFYKRRKLWKLIRVWKDYDFEFGALEKEIRECQERVERAALVEHMSEMHLGRHEQTENIKAQRAASRAEAHRNIVRWLAPLEYDADYYEDDLAAVRKLRHPGTCEWVLSNPHFKTWLDSKTPSRDAFLCFYGIPGSGKSVLASFLVDSQTSISPGAPSLVYFFFKNTDADKNTPTAAARSLLYQLYKRLDPSNHDLIDDLTNAINSSGQTHARRFQVVWDLVSKLARQAGHLRVILDALDECNEVGELLEGLLELSQTTNMKVVCTSRPERNPVKMLRMVPSLQIGPDETSGDIRAFVEYKVSKSPKLSHQLVRSSVIDILQSRSRGMFLWVALMIKELKSKITVSEIQGALDCLPDGLENIYERILVRLQSTLNPAPLEFCLRIIRWVVCATRPLKLEEIREALAVDYSADSLPGFEETLVYSERDLELACGSLLVVRNGTIQVVHLSARDYLRRSTGDMQLPKDLHRFFVDPQETSYSLATHCASYLLRWCSPEMLLPDDDRQARNLATEKLKTERPFLEYACVNWLAHAVEARPTMFETTRTSIVQFLYSRSSCGWIHLCFLLDRTTLVTVSFIMRQLLEHTQETCEGSHAATTALQALQRGLRCWLHFLQEYGGALLQWPWEIHFIHPEIIFPGEDLSSLGLPKSLRKMERLVAFTSLGAEENIDSLPESRDLEESLSSTDPPSFFEFDSARDCFFYIKKLMDGELRICCQDRRTGRKLLPIRLEMKRSRVGPMVRCAAFSADRRYLGVVLENHGDIRTGAWLIQAALDFRLSHRNASWARKLFFTRTTRDWATVPGNYSIAIADNVLYCGEGQMDLKTGDQKDHPRCNQAECSVDCLHRPVSFSGNGRLMVRHRHPGIEILSTDGRELGKSSPLIGSRLSSIKAFSFSGRYILWTGFPSVDVVEALFLENTTSGNRYLLDVPLLQFCRFRFVISMDELRLVGICGYEAQGGMTRIFVWSLEHDPVLFGERGLPYEVFGSSLDEQTNSLYLAVENGLWKRLSLSRPALDDIAGEEDEATLVRSEDKPSPIRTMQEVSQDGKWLAILQLDGLNTKLLVHVTDHPDQEADVYHLSLELKTNKAENIRFVCSPDMSTVLVDESIFGIRRGNLHPPALTLPPTTLVLDQSPTNADNPKERCLISSCNRFLALARDPAGREGVKAQLQVFSIDSGTVSRCRLEVIERSLEACIGLHISFHPFASILALVLQYETEQTNDHVPSCERFECIVWDIRHEQVLPVGELLETREDFEPRAVLNTIQFSACGSQILVRGLSMFDDRFDLPIDYLPGMMRTPPPARLISKTRSGWKQFTLRLQSHLFLSEDQSLELIIRAERDGSTSSYEGTHLTIIPIRLARARPTLLLGDGKDDKLRVVFIKDGMTPQIKYLRFSWNELMLEFPEELRIYW